MSLSGVPQGIVKTLWESHCAHLAPLSYDESAVGDLWRLFAGLLAPLPLESLPTAPAPPPAPAAYRFTVDLRGDAWNEAMRATLTGQPEIVVPLLEFFRAVLASGANNTNNSNKTSVTSSSSGATNNKNKNNSTTKASEHNDSTLSLGPVGSWRLYCAVMGDETDVTSFDLLGAALLGRLVTVRGTVVRMTPSRLSCVRMSYRCGSCGAVQDAPAEDGVLLFPGACRGRCRGYRWVPVTDAAQCEELQLLKVQEHTDRFDAAAGGSIHRMVEIELRGAWIDAITVGDTVTVCGALCARRGDGKAGAAAQRVAVRAYSAVGGRRAGGGIGAARVVDRGVPQPSFEEGGQFYEMARHPRWFARLCHALAPSIYGMQYVKEAMMLAIVGGATNRSRGRSNIHLLMVGDPGLGKSQLLRAACAVAPRSAFVCAHTSSSCGLTLTLARDPTSGEMAFEAGAVVHGDGGVTCIDEIDKGVTEHKALLEVMEQETVSMAKAGMIFSVPVHTSILAAGNPIGGRFDDAKGVTGNLNLSPALLSRFDIVVCLRNTQVGAGRALTDHVLQLHRYYGGMDDNGNSCGGTTAGAILPTELVQRFVAFCRDNCQPSLREEAGAVLAAHYLSRRAETQEDQLQVTPRFLQALLRVAEARAKVELRHEVTADDAQYAVDLLAQCAGSLRGGGAMEKMPNGATGARKRSQRERVVDALKAEVGRTGVNALPRRIIITACEEAGCRNPEAMLHQLNEVGVILQCGDKYQLRGV